jgi:hypothetical protein
MEGDVKTIQAIDGAHGEFGGGPAKIGEVEGVFYTYRNGIIAIGVRGSTPSHRAEDADPIQRLCAVHVIYRPMNGHILSTGPAAKKENDKKG